jgi:hypothetical protein
LSTPDTWLQITCSSNSTTYKVPGYNC